MEYEDTEHMGCNVNRDLSLWEGGEGIMIIWSMFDGSGIMGLPWAEAGHTVYCFNADSGNHGEYMIKMRHENLHYINCWIDLFFNHFASVVLSLSNSKQII